MATKVSKPLVCRLCGYGWTPRLTQRLPKCCPRCRSYAWAGPTPGKLKWESPPARGRQ